MPYSSILVSLAGKAEEKKLLDEAVKLATQLNSTITFVHVNDPHAGKMNMMMDSLKKVTEAEIRVIIAKFGYVDYNWVFANNKTTYTFVLTDTAGAVVQNQYVR